MYTLVIGRAFPKEKTGMMGIFEFENATLLAKKRNKTIYLFVDTRSIKYLKKINKVDFIHENVSVIGYHLPIGGTPKVIFDRIKYRAYYKLLKSIIKKHGIPDIIHIHFPLLNLTKDIWNLLRNLNIPIIVTEHWSKVQKKKIEGYRKDLLITVLNESSLFITVNKVLKNSILEMTETNKEIKVLPNMVSSEFNYLNQKVNIHKFRFIAIGRLVEQKRYSDLVKAFHRAFKNDDCVELIIVGDGPKKKELNLIIKELNLNHKVTLTGFLSRKDVVAELQKSDVYVSSSDFETFGVPYIEALACGKPIIGQRNGVIEHLLPGRLYGVFYNNIFDIDSSMRKLYENIKEYNSALISKETNEKFGEDSVYRRLIDLYTKVRKEYNCER